MGLFGFGRDDKKELNYIEPEDHNLIVLKKHKELLQKSGSIRLEGIASYGIDLTGYIFRFRIWDNSIVRLDVHNYNGSYADSYMKFTYNGEQELDFGKYKRDFRLRLTNEILNSLALSLGSVSYSAKGGITWSQDDVDIARISNLFNGINGRTIDMRKSVIVFEGVDSVIYDTFELQQIYFQALVRHLEELNDEYKIFLQDEWTREFRRLHNITDLDPDMQERFEILKEIEDNITDIYSLSDRNIELRNKYFNTL